MTLVRRENRAKVYEITRHVLIFFDGNWGKVDEWFMTDNPAFGTSPNQMIENGLADRVLKWVLQQIEENKPPAPPGLPPIIGCTCYNVGGLGDHDNECEWLQSKIARHEWLPARAAMPVSGDDSTEDDNSTEDIFFVSNIPPGEVFRTVDHEPGSMICGMKLALTVSISSLSVYVDGKDGSLQMMSPTTRVRLCSVC